MQFPDWGYHEWCVAELYNRVFRGLAVFIFEALCVCVWKLEILQNAGLKLAWNLHHYLAIRCSHAN